MAERPKVCILCGAPIVQPAHGARKYCATCAVAQKKDANTKNLATWHARKRKKAVEHYDHCAKCGEPFPPGTSPLQKYCRACSLEIHRTQARENARKKAFAQNGLHKRVNKPCQMCGKMMQQVDRSRKYCMDCLRARDIQRKADARAVMGSSTAPVDPAKKTSHEKIVEDNAAAIAKGMTYGQFKEWQRRQKELMEREETGSMA